MEVRIRIRHTPQDYKAIGKETEGRKENRRRWKEKE